MALWGNNSAHANNAPMYPILDNGTANGQVIYGNTTIGAFVEDMAVDVVGVVSSNTNIGNHFASSGWNLIRYGTGQLLTIAVANAGGNSTHMYTNTDVVVVNDPNSPNPNSTFSVTTLANGGISSLTPATVGGPFTGSLTTATVLAANGAASNGSGAVFTMVFGGRANRAPAETLVAMSSMV